MSDIDPSFLSFLSQQGADFGADGGVTGFRTRSGQNPSSDFIAPLTDLGVMAVHGADAEAFLQGQLTNDVKNLGPHHAQLSGYCTPKGRLLASFLHWREGEIHYLALASTLQAAIQKRLRMFVLRAKVQLSEAGATHCVFGIASSKQETIATLFGVAPPALPWERKETVFGALIAMPGSARHPLRWVWVAPPAIAMEKWPSLCASLCPASTAVWRASEIEAGIAHITPQTQELFVPQAINFELVGGVSFKKGCYPGQEIVARSQYLGKLKRRAAWGVLDTTETVPAGSDIFHSASPQEPIGRVIHAVATGPERNVLLFECPIAATQSGQLHWNSAQGPEIHLQPLPYPIAVDTA